jgi:iron complex outermembrane recepter protein
MKLLISFLFLVIIIIKTDAQDTTAVFTLGGVTVTASKFDSLNTIGKEMIDLYNKTDIAEAISLIPGVLLIKGGTRNESNVYIRGFDSRQIPLFIDGIPVYIPYDGSMDLARFSSVDVSQIVITKGNPSLLYGYNSLGGSINIISQKPEKNISANGKTGWLSGGYRSNLNLGSRIGSFYLQGVLSRIKTDYFSVSTSLSENKFNQSGNRGNSNRNDDKYNIILGFNPNEYHEYAIVFQEQKANKGNPVYCGNDTNNRDFNNPRFWQWTHWDKQSIYFISNTKINDNFNLKTRIFLDKFYNELSSYDNNSYNTQLKKSSFTSFYNDKSCGGSIEIGNNLFKKHDIIFSGLYKFDTHKENNLNEPARLFEDATLSLCIEDIINFEYLSIVCGFSWNYRQGISAGDYNSGTMQITEFPNKNNNAFNALLKANYILSEQCAVSIAISRNSRFPTMKERYSYRLGIALPNPDLLPEEAYNLDISFNNHLFSRVSINSSFFCSFIKNSILTVDNVINGLQQSQNAGKAIFYGAELSLSGKIMKNLDAGINYSFIIRENSRNHDLKFTDVPCHNLRIFARKNLFGISYLLADVEINSYRFSTSYGTKADGFLTFNLIYNVKVWKYISLESGINNILDTNYSLTEGYPEPGRNFFINIVYDL